MIAPGERIEAKVMRQLARALAPALGDVRVDWGGTKVRQAPHQLPPSSRAAASSSTASSRKGRRPTSSSARTAPPARSRSPRGSGRRAPRKARSSPRSPRGLIRDLEEGASPLHTRRGSLQARVTRDAVKEEIVRLGVTFGLVSRETSYVAVEERATPVTGEMELRKVPIALTRGWSRADTRAAANLAAPSHVMASMAPASFSRRVMPAGDEDTCYDMDLSVPPPTAPSGRQRESSLFSRVSEPAPKLRKMLSRVVPAAAPPAPSVRPLDRLVSLQRAIGSWELDGALAEALGVPLESLEAPIAGAPGDAEVLRRTWATELALAWLARNAAEAEDEWRLLARKARAWLNAFGAPPLAGRPWADLAAATLGG